MSTKNRVGRPSHPDMQAAVKMVRAGASRTQAAQHFNLSVPSVSRACRGAGIKPGKPGPREGAAIRHPRWKGVDWSRTNTAIAKDFGLTPERVRQVRHLLGKAVGK